MVEAAWPLLSVDLGSNADLPLRTPVVMGEGLPHWCNSDDYMSCFFLPI